MSFCANSFLSAFRCIRTEWYGHVYRAYRQKRGEKICLTAQSAIEPLIQGSACDDGGLDLPRKEKHKYIQSKRV